MKQAALELPESTPQTMEQALQVAFQQLPRKLKRRGFNDVMNNELMAHCLQLAARHRLRKQKKNNHD